MLIEEFIHSRLFVYCLHLKFDTQIKFIFFEVPMKIEKLT